MVSKSTGNDSAGTKELRLAYSIDELVAKTSLSKSYIRNEIRERKLISKKFGRRVLVLVSDWEAYCDSKR